MGKDFSKMLPDPKEIEEQKNNPEVILQKLANDFNNRYNGRIKGIVTSMGRSVAGVDILSYTFYLQFNRHNDFVYLLFSADCVKNIGNYPLNITTHYSPLNEYIEVKDEKQFENVIEEILKDEKTRMIILSMY